MTTTVDVDQQVSRFTDRLYEMIHEIVSQRGVSWTINFLETDFVPSLSELCRDAYPDEVRRNEVMTGFAKSIINYVMIEYRDQLN